MRTRLRVVSSFRLDGDLWMGVQRVAICPEQTGAELRGKRSPIRPGPVVCRQGNQTGPLTAESCWRRASSNRLFHRRSRSRAVALACCACRATPEQERRVDSGTYQRLRGTGNSDLGLVSLDFRRRVDPRRDRLGGTLMTSAGRLAGRARPQSGQPAGVRSALADSALYAEPVDASRSSRPMPTGNQPLSPGTRLQTSPPNQPPCPAPA